MKESILILLLAAESLTLIHAAKLPYGSPAAIPSQLENKKALATMALSHAKPGENAKAEDLPNKAESKELTLIKTFISEDYSGNTSDLYKALQFLGSVDCADRSEGLRFLYLRMEALGLLSNPEILNIAFLLEFQLLLNSPNDNTNNFMELAYMSGPGLKGTPYCLSNANAITNDKETLTMLSPHVDKILNQWTAMIQNHNYQEILNFMKSTDEQIVIVDFYLDKIINKLFKSARSRDDAFRQTMDFISDVPYLGTVAVAYLSLLGDINGVDAKSMEELMLVSYSLHQRMSIEDETLKNSIRGRNSFEIVKNRIPSEIRNLFWMESCTIENVKFGEELYAQQGLPSSERAALFTSSSKIDEDSDISKKWAMKIYLSLAGKFRVYVENKILKGDKNEKFYLCGNKNEDEPVVTTKADDNDCQWFLRPVAGNGALETITFLLKRSDFSNGNKDYLRVNNVAGRITWGQRIVLVNELEDSSYWKLDCV